MTGFGSKGNFAIGEEFNRYVERFPKGQNSGISRNRRVMVSGFGLFEGIQYNISQKIIESLSLNQNQISNRTIVLNGEEIDFCFLTFDVKWDLAGALLAFEASHFRPDLILMTGRGNAKAATIEMGAMNIAVGAPGFTHFGESDESNTPLSASILPDLDASSVVDMPWNSKRMEEVVRPKIEALGYGLDVAPGARPENNYVCNNISFTLLHFSNNNPLLLGDGAIRLSSPQFSPVPLVGFFHFPAIDEDFAELPSSQLIGWGEVILSLVSGALNAG